MTSKTKKLVMGIWTIYVLFTLITLGLLPSIMVGVFIITVLVGRPKLLLIMTWTIAIMSISVLITPNTAYVSGSILAVIMFTPRKMFMHLEEIKLKNQ